MKYTFLSKTRLQGNTKYDYCPKCWEEMSGKMNDPMLILNPVFFAKVSIKYKTQYGYKNKTENLYICERCRTELSYDEWINKWCEMGRDKK